MRLEDIQLASPAFKADPHPTYARLRAETPAARVRLPNGDAAWLVGRYEDVAALLRDPRLAKDPANALTPEQMARRPWMPSVLAPLTRNMLERDDPDHARLRRLVGKAFTSRRVAAMEARTAAVCDDLLDRIEGRDGFDLIADFALPFPVTVISEMLGVPQGDRARFARWSNALVTNTMTPVSLVLTLPHVLALLRFLRRLIAAKRRVPADDLVTALVEAEETGDALSAEELLAMVALLLSAGHETTANLIGNGVLALLRHPEQLRRLQEDPSLGTNAVEELLRFEGPADTTTSRYAREDMDIGGVPIRRGEVVLGALSSANRDEGHFDDPGRLDLGRAPNPHLAFGAGGHYCLGAALARMEGRVALTALLRRRPRLALAVPPDRLRWRRGLVLRGLTALPLSSAP